ncbi:MAG: DUF4474 domain-containing protein [Clostridia bacterium]|nr:DUF4474 domain-containing protein [Clostridia bacterium]
MSKSTRNVVITVAVVVIVAVAALPFVLKALNRDAAPVDTLVSETAGETNGFTFPEENVTDEIITDILNTMENIEQDVPTQPTQPTQAQQTQPTQPTQPQSTTQAQQTPSTTKKNETTTKKEESTTKKQETTTAAPAGDNVVTAVNGVDAMANGGVVSYMWNPEGNFYYVEDNPWQRNFGFNLIYDWGAAMVCMYYDTWRAQFDYANEEWMIQSWKGQYGFLFIGGEIGVYTRQPGSTGSHYNCADDNHLINMEMSIWYDAHDGNGYKLMFTRAYYPHWWSTGFVDGHLADYKFNDRSCLIMTARLTMYDEAMRDAFTASLEGCGFRRVESKSEVSTASSDTFTTVGNDVYFSWKNIDQGITVRG